MRGLWLPMFPISAIPVAIPWLPPTKRNIRLHCIIWWVYSDWHRSNLSVQQKKLDGSRGLRIFPLLLYQRIQVDPRNIHYTKRNVPPGPYKQCATPPRRCQILGLHLDRRLTWHKHIFAKRKQLGITLTKMYWLLGRKSKLSRSNKLLIYKTKLKPIWTYGIQLWGTASTSNIEILECFQSKALRMIVDAPWYVQNTVIRRDLQIPTVKEEIRYSSQYSARLSAHPNDLIVNFIELPDNRRLRRHLPNDLHTRFLV
jgi:hypothetical protein